mgnify:CR=1 FL=1
MLIEFSTGNFLSFKDIITFNMQAANIKEHPVLEDNVISLNYKIEKKTLETLEDKIDIDKLKDLSYRFFTKETLIDELNNLKFTEKDINIILEHSKLSGKKELRLLKTCVLYGANASGKSNLLKAMGFMSYFVHESVKETGICEKLEGDHFRLSNETYDKPPYFQIIFLLNGIIYRYGFEADSKKINSEWLFYTPKTKEIALFKRENGKINIGSNFREGKGCIDKTRDNALFLSVVHQFNGKYSTKIYKWFKECFSVISGLNTEIFGPVTEHLLTHKKRKRQILDFLRMADLDIVDLEVKEEKVTDKALIKFLSEKVENFKEDGLTTTRLYSLHKKYDNSGEITSYEKFNFTRESRGTQKFFEISWPVLITLLEGNTLVIDELDSRLHPILSKKIIDLFNNHKNRNAQLIFACHDTCLLKKEYFRRDQIWFTEKDEYEATDLYSLIEYKGVRNDASYDKEYIQGKYGAIPYVGNFDYFYEDIND